jgi:hypothetical protein
MPKPADVSAATIPQRGPPRQFMRVAAARPTEPAYTAAIQ